jgi:hypothetical protein
VTSFEDVDLFFGGITGIPTFTVSARAMAACGAVKSVCGLWPIAFSRSRWEQMWDGGAGCGQEFYVWDDDKIVNCALYDCDLNDDGRDDIVVGGDRGWLDLSGLTPAYDNDCIQPGCGASEIACLIRQNSSSRFEIPEGGLCVSGDSGVKAGVASAVNARAGDTVAIPLYSGVGCTSPSGNCPGGLTYRITSIGCVRVVAWENNLRIESKYAPPPKKTPTPAPSPTPGGPPTPTATPVPTKVPDIIGKAIRVVLNCGQDCMSRCGATSGRPGAPWEDRAVSLIE